MPLVVGGGGWEAKPDRAASARGRSSAEDPQLGRQGGQLLGIGQFEIGEFEARSHHVGDQDVDRIG